MLFQSAVPQEFAVIRFYYFPLTLYTKNLIFLSLIIEVCNILLKKSKTESTCKQTNATP